MARQSKDADTMEVFGVDELEKAFGKMLNKFPDEVDALLMAQGRVANNRVKSKTPIGKTKKLKGSWRLKPVKMYGQTKVVRIQSQANHAHLVEDGHKIVTTRRSRNSSGQYEGKLKRTGKTSKYNSVQKAAHGIRSSGRVEGKEMLKSTMKELQSGYFSAAEKMFDNLTKDVEL